jgi:hypothetical protein
MQGDDFGTGTTEEDLQLGYKYGYKSWLIEGKAWGRPQDPICWIR